MRSFWLTGWLLVSLLTCSAADPRMAVAGVPAPTTRPSADRPANPLHKLPRTNIDLDEVRAAMARAGLARAEKVDELSAGWSRRKQLLQDAATAYDQIQAILPGMTQLGIRAIGFRLDRAGSEQLAEFPANDFKRLMGFALERCPAILGTAPCASGAPLAVIWLARSRASRGAADHEDPALARTVS